MCLLLLNGEVELFKQSQTTKVSTSDVLATDVQNWRSKHSSTGRVSSSSNSLTLSCKGWSIDDLPNRPSEASHTRTLIVPYPKSSPIHDSSVAACTSMKRHWLHPPPPLSSQVDVVRCRAQVATRRFLCPCLDRLAHNHPILGPQNGPSIAYIYLSPSRLS